MFGYPGIVQVPFTYDTRTGGPRPVFDALGDLAPPEPGTIISLPVLDSTGGGGGGTSSYQVTGVIAVKVCGIDRNGSGTKGACWNPSLVSSLIPPQDPNETLFQYRPVQITAAGSTFTYSGSTPQCTSFNSIFCIPAVFLQK